VKRQRKFVRRVLDPAIAEASMHNDGSLDEEDFDKIRGYYGFGVPAIVGEGFCTVRGAGMTQQERMASTFQGALTGLYDDFFDKTGLAEKEIRYMMADPNSYAPASSLEKLFIHFLKHVRENLRDEKLFSYYFEHVFTAQVQSKKQLKKDLARDEIKAITFDKGGYSLLFYRSVFEHAFQEGEEEALYNIGGLMQLGNDIFDVYKDSRAGIRTLASDCEQVNDVRQEFLLQLDHCLRLISRLDYRKTDIRRFIHKFILGISRCSVCLDQLEKLQERSPGRFTPSEYSREELICDMEKPSNMLRSMRYFINYPF
jgi:hypothetical protein